VKIKKDVTIADPDPRMLEFWKKRGLGDMEFLRVPNQNEWTLFGAVVPELFYARVVDKTRASKDFKL
jgi:hypothetical protein